MKKLALALGGLALGAGAAAAGDIERSQQSAAILFEPGRYAEFSFGYVDPELTGTFPGNGSDSGSMSDSFNVWSLGYKQALGSNMDVALIVDQPIGADIAYPGGTGNPLTDYPLVGTTAELSSSAVTGLLRYRFENDVSLFGGIRAETVEGSAHILTTSGVDYSLDADGGWNFGYVVGVAWEKPEIAARVSLTYNSAIDHTLDFDETSNLAGGGEGEFDTTVPQSINLEGQTGIAPDTLLFGLIRWVEWSEFEIPTPVYQSIFGDSIVYYDSDRITYMLGIGRKFTETWSGAMTFTHEPSNGDITGNLGPNDGYDAIGLGATWTQGNMKVTGGMRYIMVGDATTRVLNSEFEDNDAIAVGMRVGFTF